MGKEREICEAIRRIAGLKGSPLLLAEVTAVKAATIDVRVGGLTLTDVGLLPAEADASAATIICPAVGSTVLLADLRGDLSRLVVVGYTAIESITQHGGKNGGYVKVAELTARLNAIETKINEILTTLNATVIPTPSGTYPLSTNFSKVQQLDKTAATSIENTKLKH